MDPVSTTSLVDKAMQESVALGVLCLVIFWFMWGRRADRKEHREDWKELLGRVDKLSADLVKLNKELVKNATYCVEEIGVNRGAINAERIRRGRPSIPAKSQDGIPKMVVVETTSRTKRDTTKDAPS